MDPVTVEPVLAIKFTHGNVTYHNDWTVTVEGKLWPRQLRAAADIVERYKECSKDDKRDELSVGVRVGVR